MCIQSYLRLMEHYFASYSCAGVFIIVARRLLESSAKIWVCFMALDVQVDE
jgi:hypothetical protein